jgi:D-alanyl-D-alanine carboxypeptidase (penicillin-binding protein 5/6)
MPRITKNVLGKMTLTVMFLLACTGSLAVGTVATVIEALAPPRYDVALGNVPEPTAAAWSIVDAETGEILAERNPDIPYPIASVTKLSAATVIAARDDLFSTTTVIWADLAADGRAGRLRAADEYDLHTLLFPLLLESSNDAAATLSRTEPSLVEDMNAFALNAGLAHTAFADASGLSPGNVSTAADLAAFLHTIYTDDRHVLDITELPSYLTRENGWLNNNPFVGIPAYAGGKHGYTPEAGHTAVAIFHETMRGGYTRSIGYVLLESEDLVGDMEQLRAYVSTNISYK